MVLIYGVSLKIFITMKQYIVKQRKEYKSRLLGTKIILIDPAYTSKTCSRCGTLGDLKEKV